jgi:hypothetical protein
MLVRYFAPILAADPLAVSTYLAATSVSPFSNAFFISANVLELIR